MTSGGSYPFSYTPTSARVVVAQPAVGRVTTSPRELRDVGLAFAVLTLDIMFVIVGGAEGFGAGASGAFLVQVAVVAAVAALTGFVAHEMAHKVSAQRRGYWAEFRMSPLWLVFSLVISALSGILFAAPGATVIGGMGNQEDWGRTALAGPSINMVFAVAFYAAAMAAILAGSVLAVWLLFLAFINGWFATFNLIPYGPLDGRKVLSWSKSTWAVSMGAAVVLAVASYVGLYYGILPIR
jgi:Zn-dependent protease